MFRIQGVSEGIAKAKGTECQLQVSMFKGGVMNLNSSYEYQEKVEVTDCLTLGDADKVPFVGAVSKRKKMKERNFLS